MTMTIQPRPYLVLKHAYGVRMLGGPKTGAAKSGDLNRSRVVCVQHGVQTAQENSSYSLLCVLAQFAHTTLNGSPDIAAPVLRPPTPS